MEVLNVWESMVSMERVWAWKGFGFRVGAHRDMCIDELLDGDACPSVDYSFHVVTPMYGV